MFMSDSDLWADGSKKGSDEPAVSSRGADSGWGGDEYSRPSTGGSSMGRGGESTLHNRC